MPQQNYKKIKKKIKNIFNYGFLFLFWGNVSKLIILNLKVIIAISRIKTKQIKIIKNLL